MMMFKEFKKVLSFEGIQIDTYLKLWGISKGIWYRASVGEIDLPDGIEEEINRLLNVWRENGNIRPRGERRLKIDYELLHALDKEYMNSQGSWVKEAYDDPRLKEILYYEDERD